MICHCGDHAWKRLNSWYVTMTSPQHDFLLESGGWYVSKDQKGYKTVRKNLPRESGRRKQVILSRAVMDAPDGLVVDHINMDTLDNRTENLRLCSDDDNRLNRRARPGKNVPLKGVRLAPGGKYQAIITRHKKQHYLGTFATAEDAHIAYCEAASVIHGEFARTAA